MIVDGDTIVAITIEQSKKINRTFIRQNHYKTVTDSLGSKIVLLEARVVNDSIIIGDLKFQVDNLTEIISNNAEITDRLVEDLALTDKELLKAKRKNRWAKSGLGISLGINLGLLILFLVK